MCLSVRENAEIKIADRNILVYKVFQKPKSDSPNVYKSSYRGFTYQKGCNYERRSISIKKSVFCRDIVEEGFHSFVTKEYAKRDRTSGCEVIVRMYIPKGAKYVGGEFGSSESLVSNKIRFMDKRVKATILDRETRNYFIGL